MSKFWCEAPIVDLHRSNQPTVIICSEESSDGSVDMVQKVLETQTDPLALMSYSDFSIASMIKNGVSYKSLMISPDLRLGHDSEIDQFNSHLEEINDSLFNSKSE